MIIDKYVQVQWTPQNQKYYLNKGYSFTKMGDKFNVCIEDLSNGSGFYVNVECDCCGDISYKKYVNVKESINKYGNYYCQHCTQNRKLQERQNTYFIKVVNFCKEHNYELLTNKADILTVESIIEYICPLHGKQQTKLKSILANKQCYSCSRKLALTKKAQTTLSFRQESLYNRALEVANLKHYIIITKKENITQNTSRIIYHCNNPLHSNHDMQISNFINGKGCPECATENASKRYSMPLEVAKERIETYGGKVLNWEDYKNYNVKNLKMVCPECGNIFITSANLFCQRQGQFCNVCSHLESKCERRIRKVLEKNNIFFEQEKWFPDCRDEKPLPFDFYIPQWNLCIEYDGEQHYTDRRYKDATFSDTLEYTQLHDKIKTEYCQNNNIKLIRIPYWGEYKIEIIVQKIIDFHTKI